jgi:hypothetical protein
VKPPYFFHVARAFGITALAMVRQTVIATILGFMFWQPLRAGQSSQTTASNQQPAKQSISVFDKKVVCANFRTFVSEHLLLQSSKEHIESFIFLIAYSPKLDTCVVAITTYSGDPAKAFSFSIVDVLTGGNLSSDSAKDLEEFSSLQRQYALKIFDLAK